MLVQSILVNSSEKCSVACQIKKMKFTHRFSRIILIISLFSFIYLSSLYCYAKRKNYNDEMEMKEILRHQKNDIKQEMKSYPYETLFDRSISQLSDLVMESGGSPMRSVIVTNWRSGSSFLGELVSAHPASFYTYEPLLYFGIKLFREPQDSNEALEALESLFYCNFTKLDDFLQYRKVDPWATYQYNRYLKKLCKQNMQFCVNNEFSSKFCQLFPFQTVKIIALKLKLIEKFLKDKSLGLKILYLIRDPRGIINSRKNLDWCETSQDCYNQTSICSDLTADYSAALKFSKTYPDTFRVLRYEDLATNPYKYSQFIYDFYGLYFHESVQNFIDTHTAFSSGDAYSTFRNSSVTAFHWRNKLTFDEVEIIQRHCFRAMILWNYPLVFNRSQLLNDELFMEKSTDINYL